MHSTVGYVRAPERYRSGLRWSFDRLLSPPACGCGVDVRHNSFDYVMKVNKLSVHMKTQSTTATVDVDLETTGTCTIFPGRRLRIIEGAGF
ncbi:hypothetical protein R5R35_004685 [Gryllus longicercus]|uniref:Uncharacterized protein n=1 Tax=Gryllus longicercus TaxID=2509291 RepID=A0AAN9VYW6_9ORTH